MRLERLFTHRLVRILRFVLPVLVMVLIAIPAWNYWARIRHSPQQGPRPPQLPPELALKTDDFNFEKTEGNRTLFRIHARTNLGFTDKKNMLQDVDVTIFGDKEGEPARILKSKGCDYDQKTENILCKGDVEVQLDDLTTARTDEIVYHHAERRIATDKPTHFVRSGSMTGQSGRLTYSMLTGLLQLAGGVNVRTAQGLELRSGSAVFHERENWAAASEDVLVKSANGWIRGQRGRAELTPVTHQPRTIDVEGGVVSESTSPKDGATWNLRAGSVRATLSRNGITEGVLARTDAELKKSARDGNIVMTGDEVEAFMTPTGDLSHVEARVNAEMKFGGDRYLRANRIWSSPDGSVSTEDESVLQVGDKRVSGKAFRIRNGDVIAFSTSSRATLKTTDSETSADKTDARFDSRTNQLVSLTQAGRFTFRKGEQSGRANTAYSEDGGTKVRLEGAAKLADNRMQVEAGTIEIDDQRKIQTASKNVQTISMESGERVLVKADSVTRTEEKIIYDGKVRLYRGAASIEADRLEAPAAGEVFRATASGHVFSTLNNTRAWADMLEYDDQTRVAHYIGKVKAQKQDLSITSGDMVVKTTEKENSVSEITAKGDVVVIRGEGRGTGDQAVYDAGTQQVVLTGSAAEVNTGDGNSTRAPRITVNVSGARMAVVEGAGTQRAVTRHRVGPPQ